MSRPPLISVIIPTHNPRGDRLQRTLAGLGAQTLPVGDWETILVDNASTIPVTTGDLGNLRVVREPELGLTAARRRGFREARGELCVLVDDDNVLAADYLATVLALFARHPGIGALGGRSLPEFETPPPDWSREFFDLLALRDLGDQPLVSHGLKPAGSPVAEYPACAPIGAGMALRRAAWEAWLNSTTGRLLSDRRGAELTSGGDNDIVLCALRAGWEAAYFPTLSLIHLIPGGRLEPAYLARLNRGIQKSWMQVLSLHEANPWPPIPRWTVPLRCARAWLRHRAWSGPAAHIRWQGSCGHFAGRASALTP
jgi:glycosyltransferase involved in cell wall biosynthesis